VPETKLKALEQALKENSLTYDSWKPSGAYFYLCKAFSSTKDIVNQKWTPGEK
jgi:hypothetical protein